MEKVEPKERKRPENDDMEEQGWCGELRERIKRPLTTGLVCKLLPSAFILQTCKNRKTVKRVTWCFYASLAPVFRNHNNYFPKWLGPVFTAGYICVYTSTVISGGISVGTFLATIKVFTELSGKFAEGFCMCSPGSQFALISLDLSFQRISSDLKLQVPIGLNGMHRMFYVPFCF